jgi:hypothetical protein
LLILAGIIILAGASITWGVGVYRHKASTYGIADPSSAVLSMENRTSDFAIRRVLIEDAAGGVVVADVYSEIGTGAGVVLEIVPGAYSVSVFYEEISQGVAWRPRGSVDASFSVSPGKAVVLYMQGGRSSPDGLFFIPPELVFK